MLSIITSRKLLKDSHTGTKASEQVYNTIDRSILLMDGYHDVNAPQKLKKMIFYQGWCEPFYELIYDNIISVERALKDIFSIVL